MVKASGWVDNWTSCVWMGECDLSILYKPYKNQSIEDVTGMLTHEKTEKPLTSSPQDGQDRLPDRTAEL